MQTNVGATEARVRWALAVVLFAVAMAFNASPVITLVAALAALVMAGTALTRPCAVYRVLRKHAGPPKIPGPHNGAAGARPRPRNHGPSTGVSFTPRCQPPGLAAIFGRSRRRPAHTLAHAHTR